MAFPVTLNGRTYTLTDFEGTNYVDGLPDAFEDFVTHAGDIYNSTSTTSNSIGTGSKTFTVEANKPYQAGTPLRIADAAAPSTNFLDTVVTSYSGTTLVVNSIGYGGSGTKTSWTVNIGGAKTIDGTLGVSQGGTGATTAAAARTNLDTYSKSEADSRFLNVSGEASDVTINGDLTVDTDTLYVDGTNDRVGVNVAAPARTFEVNSGTNDTTIVATSTDDGAFISFEDNNTTGDTSVRVGAIGDDLRFDAGNGEAMRIDSSERILFGDNESQGLNRKLQSVGTTGANMNFEFIRFSNDTGSGAVELTKSRGATLGAVAIVNDDDTLGQLNFRGDDGVDTNTVGAQIKAEVDGTPGANDMPGRLVFMTTADGGNTATERMRITNGGRVGINTVGESGAPTGWLTIDNDINSANVLTNKASYHVVLGINGSHTGEYIGGIGFGDTTQSTIQGAISATDEGTSAATGIAFATGNTSAVSEAMRIDSSQRVLIGLTSARTEFFDSGVAPILQVQDSGSNAAIAIIRTDTGGDGPSLLFGRSHGTGYGIVNNGDRLGRIPFQGADGVDFEQSVSIDAYVDGTPGVQDMPGRLVFSTTADGANAATERMRIDSEGSVTVGTGAYPHDDKGIAYGDGAQRYGASIFKNQTSIATGGGLSITLRSDTGGWAGILTVMAHADGSANNYNHRIYAVMGRNTSCTFTEIGSKTGGTPPGISMSCPTAGRMKATFTIASGTVAAAMNFNGGQGF